MKILLCLNRDIYCAAILNLLLPQLKNHQVKIYFSDKIGKRPLLKDLDEMLFYEKDKSSDSAKFLTFAQISEIYSMSILDFKNINRDGVSYLKNWQVDLIISIRFGQIFKQEIIALPKYGIINFHSGILPQFQGVMASFWAMLLDSEKIGGTLHFISDEQIDTGEIIDICYLDVKADKSMIWHIFWLYFCGAEMIMRVIKNFSENKIVLATKQDVTKAQYFTYPQQKDLEIFKTKYRIFDKDDYLEIVNRWY
jgi:methionyl-tRNA formyltransferase